VQAAAFTGQARSKIEAAGGSCEVLGWAKTAHFDASQLASSAWFTLKVALYDHSRQSPNGSRNFYADGTSSRAER
jgi:hypothetical protein